MPGQPKYCPECKGFGNLYIQTITRYGDTRTKSTTRQMPLECDDCKGTGMISLQTTKTPQFKPEDIAGEPASNHLDAISGDEADAIVEESTEREEVERKGEDSRTSSGRSKAEIFDTLPPEVQKAMEAGPKIEEQLNDILEAPKKGSDDMEFEPKYNEPPEGEMPL